MSRLSWGKPKVEFTKSVDGAVPEAAQWTVFGDIKQGTSQLTTTAGERIEALDEAGDVIDTRTAKSKYSFEMQLYVKKGDTKPIEDEDGVIVDNYAIRLTPEDPSCEGFIMENTSVSVEETWSSADGKLWRYVFDGIKPASGNTLKPYNAE